MVVGGRLKHAPVPRCAKFPIILPKGHKISEMICREFHCGAHLGPDWTLSHVRMKYWIVGARQLLKRIRRGCVICKKLYAAPCNQMMADLPVERCEPGKPPFHCVGVDIFGPFHVTQGRSMVKRYGCIYTCFGIRAIHIEMLPSLETDAFINGLTRFVARRGCPAKILSDNGTNLVGAQAELSRSFRLTASLLVISGSYLCRRVRVFRFDTARVSCALLVKSPCSGAADHSLAPCLSEWTRRNS